MTQLSHQKYKYNNNYCEIFKITYVKIYEAAIIDRNIFQKKSSEATGDRTRVSRFILQHLVHRAIQGIKKGAAIWVLTISSPCIRCTHDWSSQRLFTIACELLREVFIRLNTGPTFYPAREDGFMYFVSEKWTIFRMNPPLYYSQGNYWV